MLEIDDDVIVVREPVVGVDRNGAAADKRGIGNDVLKVRCGGENRVPNFLGF